MPGPISKYTPEEKKAAVRASKLKHRPLTPITPYTPTEKKAARTAARLKWFEANKEHARAKQREWKQANPQKLTEEYHRRRKQIDLTNEIARLRSYGLTRDDYATMLKAQGGVCAICHKPDTRKLAVDHCHKTGHVRGLLCSGCNRGLGMFRDNAQSLVAAAKYLHTAAAEQLEQLLG